MATNLGPKGLHTFANELLYPEGALVEAENVVIDKDGVAEPRRGFTQFGETFGTGVSRAKQLLVYKNRTLVHHGQVLEFDSNGNGVYVPFTAPITEPLSGIRIKSQEANSNLYFTSNNGIKKISVGSAAQLNTGSVIDAGAPQAINMTGQIIYTGVPWFEPESKVAYKVVWGYKDNNNNLILGVPSPKYELINRSEDTYGGATLSISVPNDVLEGVHFFQVYRTQNIAAAPPFTVDDVQLADEYNLVYEEFPTTQEITDRLITFTDITGNDIAKTGTPLYSNELTGDGVLQENYRPPVATDITLFNGSVFYSNTKREHNLRTTLLGVLNFTSDVSDFIISNGDVTNTYTFTGTGEVAGFAPTMPHGVGSYNKASLFGRGVILYSADDVISYVVYFTDGTTSYAPEFGYPDGSLLVPIDIDATTTPDELVDAIIDQASNNPSFRTDFIAREREAGWGVEFAALDNGAATNALDTIGKNFISNITNTNPIVTLEVKERHYVSNGTRCIITDTGEPILDGNIYTISTGVPGTDDIYINEDLSSLDAPLKRGILRRATAITTIASGTNPNIYVNGGHFLETDDKIVLINTGLPTLDGNTFTITVVDPDNFTIGGDGGVGSSVGDFYIPNNIIMDSNGSGEDVALQKPKLGNTPSAAQSIRITANSLTKVMNADSDSFVNAYYISNAESLPGAMSFQNKTQEDTPFYIATSDPLTASSYSPALPVSKTATVAAGDPATMTLVDHGFETGNSVLFYGGDRPELEGVHEVTKLDDDTFTIEIEADDVGTIKCFLAEVESDNEVIPNRLYFSKYQQPEAVPIVNYLDIGSRDKAIDRILPLRESLIVFKEDGIYRVYGSIAPNFQVALFDTSAKLIAPDSAAVLNNKIYCLTTQGVLSVTDAATSVVSRPVEDKFTNLPLFSGTRTHTFSLTSETDRAYYLWTIETDDDETPTVCYRYNIFTNAWTEWPIAKTCGVLNPTQDRIYLGPADINQVEIERKTKTRFDYADRQYTLNIPSEGVKGVQIELSSTQNVKAGDVIEQLQYVTISTFNRLLNKLDADPGIPTSNFFSLLELIPGDNLLQKMIDLAAKLNIDDAAIYPSIGSNPDPKVLEGKFNEIIDDLNSLASNSFYKTFKKTNGEYKISGVVIDKILATNYVILRFERPFLEGTITHYKSIPTQITWVPQHFGDPYAHKQVPEGTFIFRFNNFTSGIVSYNSDLEQDFAEIEFDAFGPGAFGGFDFGGHTFGGQGNKVHVRTYIPRTKQRCRFLQCRFEHNNAFESYELFGVSFNPRPYSTKGYR